MSDQKITVFDNDKRTAVRALVRGIAACNVEWARLSMLATAYWDRPAGDNANEREDIARQKAWLEYVKNSIKE